MTGEISKTLQAGEHCLTAALKAANLGLWDWNVSSGEVRVDGTFCGFIGREPDNLTMSLEELTALVHEEDRESSRQAMRDALRGTTSKLQMMQRLRHADGRWVWIDTSGVVTARGADGRVTRVTGTHTEITERKQMESALSNTLRVMRTLLETLPLPVILRDTERRVTLVNAACEQMMRLPREAIVGRLLAEIPNRPPVRGHQETDDQVFATKKPLRYETTIHAPDGTSFDVIVAKTPLTAEDGSITGIASVTTDISEQKRTAQVLERARLAAEAAMQAKSRFLANMSHELRTPLNGVVGMTSLLESTPLDTRQRRFVRTLRSSAEALITLINDILDLSKAEAGKLELADSPFDLRRELEQVVGLFSARAHDKGIDVAAHIARDVPATVRGDALRLRQVLGNLVNNAVKFTESGAVLLAVKVAESREPGLHLEFSVTDSGIGIAPDVQQRIFDAFEQADGSVTRKFGGTGLGLAISRQLIELMRGSMHLSSEPGRGSRFSFVVPAGVSGADQRPARRTPNSCALLIGIHPVIRDAIRDTLGASHEQVIEAESVPQALELLRNLDARVNRVRVLVDSAASDVFGPMASAVQAIRTAAGTRHPELVVLLPPDAEIRPIEGAARTLIKPLCTIDLVAEAATSDAGHTLSVRAIPARGSRGRALVVEDNAVNQEVARTMLDMMGFEVIAASNGQEGVQAAAAHPDLRLILMDCQMPVMDGLAAARAIRATAASGPRVPIVALTGNAMPGDREACIAAGMDDYLAKPFSLTALRHAVDRWAPVEAPAALADKA